MGTVLHGNVTTTPRIRKEIQNSTQTIAALAKRYGINEKTVLRWKHSNSVEDKKQARKPDPALSELEQEIICMVRRHTLLPLDDLLDVLKPHIPALTRSNLHRCLRTGA